MNFKKNLKQNDHKQQKFVFRHQFEDEQKTNRRNSLWYLAVNYVCKFVPNIENKQHKQQQKNNQ